MFSVFDQGVCNKLHVSKREILESGNIMWDYTVPIPKFETLNIRKKISLLCMSGTDFNHEAKS